MNNLEYSIPNPYSELSKLDIELFYFLTNYRRYLDVDLLQPFTEIQLTNKEISQQLNKRHETISKALHRLEIHGFIAMSYKPSKHGELRVIYLLQKPVQYE